MANAAETLAELQKQFGAFTEASPETMKGFGAMCQGAYASSAPLDTKAMELIIVAVAVARKCKPCILSHVANLIEAGGSREELVAACNAAILICGGPGMVYSASALDAYDQLKAAK